MRLSRFNEIVTHMCIRPRKVHRAASARLARPVVPPDLRAHSSAGAASAAASAAPGSSLPHDIVDQARS